MRLLLAVLRFAGLAFLFVVPTAGVLWFFVAYREGRFYGLGASLVFFTYWGLLTLLAILTFKSTVERRRRMRRLQEGLCINCGYDLTGNVSGVCPECGAEVKQP